MKEFEIYFSDLNKEAQDRLLETIGVNDASEMNWDMDILPIAIYAFEEE